MSPAEPVVSDPLGDGVVVLRMVHDDNRFTHAFLDALEAALDRLDDAPSPVGLVLTGRDRFFSNGLDLEAVRSPGFDTAAYLARVQGLFARVLTAGYPTAAAINGHVFAAGAMLAMCCDHRVMRADRGWWCLPESDLGLPFTPGMSTLCAWALPAGAVTTRTMVYGERLGGADAAALGVVDAADDDERVEEAAVAWVRARMGKDRAVVAAIKQGLRGDVAALLRRADPAPHLDPG